MSTDVAAALAALKGLGTPEELKILAAKGVAPQRRPKVNSHIHLPPNFSAFQTVQQAVELAAAQDVGVVGVSNYYHYGVYGDFVALARKHRIFPLFGLEIIALIDELVKAGVKINDPGNPGKMYICGKGITRFAQMTAEGRRLLDLIRTSDSQRMAKVVQKLAEVFEARGVKTDLTESAVIDMVMRRHGSPRETVYLQERHACQAFQETFFKLVPPAQRIEKLNAVLGAATKAGPEDAVKIQNDIRAALMKAGKVAYVDETFVNFQQARSLILELGGIPCYPTLADGASPLCGFEDPIEKLIENIQSSGIHMAEFIPLRNTPETLTRYVQAMRRAGLVVVGGTEHNTLDLLPIEPACLGGKPVPEEIKDIFWEGACVVAAHQFLTLHGECGFVDGQGRPNSAYATAEQRIAAFRSLGAAVIQKYFEACAK